MDHEYPGVLHAFMYDFRYHLVVKIFQIIQIGVYKMSQENICISIITYMFCIQMAAVTITPIVLSNCVVQYVAPSIYPGVSTPTFFH